MLQRQSQPLAGPAAMEGALSQARATLHADPGMVPDEWVSYAVTPERVEFWQGDVERRHQRLQYTRDADGWAKTLLWP